MGIIQQLKDRLYTKKIIRVDRAQTTIERRKESLIIYRLRQLEQDVVALKANQLQEIQFGNILLSSLVGNGVIQTSVGSTITGGGLVSTTSFPTNDVIISSTNSTASTSYVDYPGSTLPNFSTAGSDTRALIIVLISARNTAFYNTGNGINFNIVDTLNGSPSNLFTFTHDNDWYLVTIDFVGQTWTTGNKDRVASYIAEVDLSQGIHSLKLQYKANTSGTATVDFVQLSYLLLGNV